MGMPRCQIMVRQSLPPRSLDNLPEALVLNFGTSKTWEAMEEFQVIPRAVCLAGVHVARKA